MVVVYSHGTYLPCLLLLFGFRPIFLRSDVLRSPLCPNLFQGSTRLRVPPSLPPPPEETVTSLMVGANQAGCVLSAVVPRVFVIVAFLPWGHSWGSSVESTNTRCYGFQGPPELQPQPQPHRLDHEVSQHEEPGQLRTRLESCYNPNQHTPQLKLSALKRAPGDGVRPTRGAPGTAANGERFLRRGELVGGEGGSWVGTRVWRRRGG